MSLLEDARRLADDLLRPAAEQVDRTQVPRSHLDALAAAGLVGLTGPEARPIVEIIAGACAATWFVLTQHATPLAVLAESDNLALQERLLAPMLAGEILSGIAIAHLRRPVSPVSATRLAGSWRFDGTVSWMTGWGLCDVVLLCARSGNQVVQALVPAVAGPGLTPGPPLPLLAMQATGTVTLDLDGYVVHDADVVAVHDYATWAEKDREKAVDVTPAVFGVQRESVRLLRERAPALAFRLGGEGDRLRAKAYAAIGDASRYDERLALRVEALALCLRSATALVIATGGAAMALDHPAQRHLREAAFLQVQGQTPALRAAMIDAFDT